MRLDDLRLIGRRILCWVLIAALANNPVYGLWRATATLLLALSYRDVLADPFLGQAANGELFGDRLLRDFKTPTADPVTGTMTLHNGAVAGQTMEKEGLFQEIRPGSMDDIAAAYGDDAAFGSAANDSLSGLLGSGSSHANAYRTLLGANTSMPDMSNDPLWKVSDAIYSLKTPTLSDLYSGCRKTTTIAERTCNKRLPDIKTCRKTLPAQSCTVTRDVKELPLPIVKISGEGTFVGLDENTIEILQGSTDMNALGAGCPVATRTLTVEVTDSPRILSAAIVEAGADDNVTLDIDGHRVLSTGGCSDRAGWSSPMNVNITSYLKPTGQHTLTMRVLTGGDTSRGGGFVRLHVKRTSNISETLLDFPVGCRERLFDGWPPQGTAPQPWVPSGSDNDAASNAWWQCTDAAFSRTFGTVEVTADKYGDVLAPLLPGAPATPPAPICYAAKTRVASGLVTLPCFTDINGNRQCPQGTVDTTGGTTCDNFANNPNCAWLGETCAADATDPVTGTCREFIQTYDCGQQVTGLCGQENIAETTICDSPIRCMGGECVDPGVESNKDFIKAASALQLLNEVQKKSGCDAATGDCPIFSGEPQWCQMADLSFLGSVDCCNMPLGGSWIEYMNLAVGTWELADLSVQNYALANFGGNAVAAHGAWTLVTNGTFLEAPIQAVNAGWTAITSTFTEMMDSVVTTLTGETLKGAVQAATAGLTALQTQVFSFVGQWVFDVFGPQAANALFNITAAPVYDSVGQLSQPLIANGMSQTLASIIQVVGIMYAMYNIAKMVVQLVFACTQDETKLNMLKTQRMCTRPDEIGNYCSASVLFSCVARKEAYCCFSSPFARIFQQQARKQLGIGFGPPKAPDCAGIPINQVGALDFDRMDFSEWIDMMRGAGQLPDSAAEAESMFSAVYVTSSNVMGVKQTDVGKRLESQVEGGNIDDIRQYMINNMQ